ncbi:uncharacterized protein N7459_000102 [Penicillium hispanicum]|uniref:uncharacterized protein n=1 Tax=Penicillium hispanicum TaxID=1080232 RepID=UPI00253F833E|nr:uncharacterized protein N7459_000102 [Penicillium hispanicum]KAJ5593894.1 hypothetical protein N7459_000102 [Penicillium hispanicum]
MTYMDEIQIAGSSAQQLPGSIAVVTMAPISYLVDEAVAIEALRTISPFACTAFPRNVHPSRLPRHEA